MRLAVSLILSGLFLAACAPATVGDGGGDGATNALTGVPGTVRVHGTTYSVEKTYLPRVVQCENPNAPPEALRAQAIAARTYLTYRTKGQASPSIADGQSEQVFTCSSNQNGSYVSDAVKEAVAATAGQVVTHDGNVIAGFFVAGAKRIGGSCSKGTDATNTEHYVTVNVGRTGSSVISSTIGSKSSPDNRGALGQNFINCLAKNLGYKAPQLLAYFYGADIVITGNPDSTTIPDGTVDLTTGDPVSPSPVGTCWSYTTQSDLAYGACVTSQVDGIVYQCRATGDWVSGVTDGAGPEGTCTSIN